MANVASKSEPRELLRARFRDDARGGCGLGSAGGESVAESGEKRFAERSRSATPAAEPQTEALRFCGIEIITLVTSARFEQRNRRGREGDGVGRKPVQRSKPCVGHGGFNHCFRQQRIQPFSKESPALTRRLNSICESLPVFRSVFQNRESRKSLPEVFLSKKRLGAKFLA